MVWLKNYLMLGLAKFRNNDGQKKRSISVDSLLKVFAKLRKGYTIVNKIVVELVNTRRIEF